MKNESKDSYIVGEIWHNATEWISAKRLDGVTNYAISRAILGYVCGEEHKDWEYKWKLNDIIHSYSPEQLKNSMSKRMIGDLREQEASMKTGAVVVAAAAVFAVKACSSRDAS